MGLNFRRDHGWRCTYLGVPGYGEVRSPKETAWGSEIRPREAFTGRTHSTNIHKDGEGWTERKPREERISGSCCS